MAVKETPARYKGFTFDGVDSKNYGVYIQDGGMFDAPARDVEMIEIPGRNGAYALDKGRFENVTLTYQAFIPQDSETDFVEAIRDFRNQLASRKGYCRLEDEFNTDEYRLAVFKDGLAIDNVSPKVGTFDIVFDCKPQRYLTSGETAITVASGDTITNPTLFEASPLLEIQGYGTITLQDNNLDSQITVSNDEYGTVLLADQTISETATSVQARLDTSPNYALLNTGDSVYLEPGTTIYCRIGGAYVPGTPTVTVSGWEGVTAKVVAKSLEDLTFTIAVTMPRFHCTVDGNEENTATVTVSFRDTGISPAEDITATFTVYCQSVLGVVSRQRIIARKSNVTITGSTTGVQEYNDASDKAAMPPVYGISTKRPLDGVTGYIDLDFGEAYAVIDGETVSINNNVAMPAKLPALNPGDNEVIYDNTFTSVKITPRWWRV